MHAVYTCNLLKLISAFEAEVIKQVLETESLGGAVCVMYCRFLFNFHELRIQNPIN